MIHRFAKRFFTSEVHQESSYWPYIKWLGVIPFGLFSLIAIYEHKQEKKRIEEWLANYDESKEKENPLEKMIRNALKHYQDSIKQDFLDEEIKENLRTACIEHGTTPKDYNEFYALLNEFKDNEPMVKQVLGICANPEKSEQCRVLIQMSNMFDFIT